MQDDTMVVLAEYNTITEAEISKSMLDSAGIWSTIRNEYMSAIYPIGTAGPVGRPRRRTGKGPHVVAAQIGKGALAGLLSVLGERGSLPDAAQGTSVYAKARSVVRSNLPERRPLKGNSRNKRTPSAAARLRPFEASISPCYCVLRGSIRATVFCQRTPVPRRR